MMNTYKVLVVNDDPEQLNIIDFALADTGFHVLRAYNGHDGYVIARKEKPDLVISDVMMPGWDGMQLCRAIRSDKELNFIPILLVSALQKGIMANVQSLEFGADDFIELPCEPMRLVAKAARLAERKRMDEALRQSENRFRSLIENLTDVISVLAPDGTIFYESPSIETVLGYKPEELIGKNAFDLLHPEDVARATVYFKEAVQKTKTSESLKYRCRHKDGSWRVVESVGKIFNDPADGLVAIINTRDITEQVKAQESLRISEERFQLVSLATEDALWDWDLQTDAVWFSRSLLDLLGHSPEEGEATIDLWYDAIHPEDKKRVISYIQNVIESGEHFWMDEYRLCSKNGSIAHIFDRGYIVHNDDGKPIRMTGAAINFTERKQAESKLRFQKILLEAQSEASIDGILVVSTEGKIISHNSRFAEMWEIPDEILANKSDEKFIQSVTDKLIDPQEFLETVTYLYKNPKLKDQVEIHLKDGHIFECFTAPMLDADDTHFGRVWFFRDISNRKKVEESIRFKAHLLNTVQQAVIATDLNGIITYWNQFAQKLYGWTSQEAVGRSILELTTPHVKQEEAEKIMSRLSSGKSWSGEFLVKNKNGELFPAHVTNSPVFDGENKLIGIVGISFDISERMEAEKALTEANERAIREYDRLLQKLTTLAQATGAARDLTTVFRAIYEFAKSTIPCTGFFISLYDAKKNQRTPAFAVGEGEEYDVSNLPPMPMSKSPNSRAVSTGEIIIENDFQAAMAGQPIVNIGLDKDPNLPQSCLVTPMSMMGRIIGAVEVQSSERAAYTQEHATVMQMAANIAANAIENVRLIQEEQERTEQLILSQRLESVGRLAGGIAHDFNNMLTAINGYSELTLRRLKEDDPLRHNIEEIKKAGERSAALTHQLLAFSRKQVLKPKILNLNDVISDTSKMLQRLLGEDVQLNFIPDEKLGLVEADPGQLTQVVMNLAVNARDAMPRGGSLTIETENVFLERNYELPHFTIQTGAYVTLAVSDNGIGMDEEIQQFIFEPFFTTKEVGKGTGLGLATVYGIVKQSGGYIWVYSEVDKGTTFKVYLPRVDRDARLSEEGERAENAPGGTETILLVEDEEMVRNLSHQILKTCGYRVLEARNGVEALDICKNADSEIDLLMTDVVMPKMGGRELAEKMAVLYPQIRLLYTSGYTDDAIIRQGVIEPGENFIQKPFTFEALAKKIRELLDERKLA